MSSTKAASTWVFEQINFFVGNYGYVVDSNFYTKLRKRQNLNVSLWVFIYEFPKFSQILWQQISIVFSSRPSRPWHRRWSYCHFLTCYCQRHGFPHYLNLPRALCEVALSLPKHKIIEVQEGKKTDSSPIMWRRCVNCTIGWFCSSFSKCGDLQGQKQMDQGMPLGTMCMCKEVQGGTNKAGAIERKWNQGGHYPNYIGIHTHKYVRFVHASRSGENQS